MKTIFKKSVFAALTLFALAGNVFADLQVSVVNERATVTGSGTYQQLLEELESYGALTFLRFSDGCEVIFREGDETRTPLVSVIEFEDAVFTFEDLVCLKPNLEETGWGPGMLVGTTDWYNVVPGSLTVNVSTAAVNKWLGEQESLLSYSGVPLVLDIAEIKPTGSDNVHLNFVAGDGSKVSIGQQFQYDNYEFTNVGIVLNEGTVRANQIGLLFTQGANGAWGGGTLSLVALGSEYVNPNPTLPEPTTGTLSLLALAGLAARRRRK